MVGSHEKNHANAINFSNTLIRYLSATVTTQTLFVTRYLRYMFVHEVNFLD